MNKKKIVRLMTIFGLVMTLNVTVLADPLSDLFNNKAAQEKQFQNDNNSLKQSQQNVDEIEMEIEKIDFEIEKLMRQLDDNKISIANSQKDIEKAQQNVGKAQVDIDAQQKLFDERMRAIYKSGTDGYLNMMLDAKGVGDLLSRIEAISKIIGFDKKVQQDLEHKKVILLEKKKALDEENIKLLALKAENEQKLSKITSSKSTQVALINEAKKQRNIYLTKTKEGQAAIKASQAAIAAAELKIKQLSAATPKYIPSRGTSVFSTDKVVVFASNFLGTQYVWGGNTPNPGFDCSGYMKYVYNHFGISIGRTTYDQINEGEYISRDNLQPGDLVFFGSSSNPHHVGMYVGGNCYIHAPQTGDVIKVSALTRSDYLTARRVR